MKWIWVVVLVFYVLFFLFVLRFIAVMAIVRIAIVIMYGIVDPMFVLLSMEMEYPPTGTDVTAMRAVSDWAVLSLESVTFSCI